MTNRPASFHASPEEAANSAPPEKLLYLVTLRVFGPDHVVLAVVEANDIEAVRDFIFQSRLIQWNTTKIHATYSMEEALERAGGMEAIF